MTGIGLLFIYVIILGFIYFLCRKEKNNLLQFVFLSQRINRVLLVPSIFSSWLWIVSVIGAAEACILYGELGGLAFAVGTGMGFSIFIFSLLKFRRLTERKVFFSDYIGLRFGGKMQTVFNITAVLLIGYVVMEQAVGISALFSAVFGVSFKITAFISIILPLGFVIMSGMKGVIIHDFISFFFIVMGLAMIFLLITNNIGTKKIMEALDFFGKTNILITAEKNQPFVMQSVRYAVSAMLIGFAQSCLDPIYYLKATVAKSEAVVRDSFLIGGFLVWFPIVLLSAFFFGYLPVHMNVDFGQATYFITAIVNKVLVGKDAAILRLIFCCVVLLIGSSTIINSFMGIQGLSIQRVYPLYGNRLANDEQKMKYGRLITVLIGVFCAMIAISLENISLLKIDIFSGIFFATPASIFLYSLFDKKVYGDTSVVAFIIGSLAGIGTWLYIQNRNLDWFYATGISFFLPMVYLKVTSVLQNRG